MKRINYRFILTIIVLIFLYHIISIIVDNNIIIPSISALVEYIETLTVERILTNSLITIFRTFLSFLISLILALFLAILANYKKMSEYINPVIGILKTIPVISVIIIAFIWLGRDKSIILIGFLIIFPILYEMFYHSIKNVDKKLLDVCKIYNFDIIKKIKYLYFYCVIENFLISLKQTFGLGFKVMVMSEVIGQVRAGIGAQIYNEKVNTEMAGVFIWTIILIIIVLLVDNLISISSRKIMKWV